MNTRLFIENGFELSLEEEKMFEKYLQLFLEYNSHTNLSAIRDESGIIEKHFVDSLYGVSVISDYIQSGDSSVTRLLDIGSGGGFPGIPLKIVLPNLDVTLLDSVGKKVKAMNYFVENLGLEKIRATQERAEALAKNPQYMGQYDIIVSRATAYITDILMWSLPFLKPDGKIILYKMPSEDESQDQRIISKKLSLNLEGELPYTLGGKDRVLLIFTKRDEK